MPDNENGPVGGSSLRRAKIKTIDTPDYITTAPINSSPAAKWLARHFGLTTHRAALIASLAGIGINIAPALPAMIGGGR